MQGPDQPRAWRLTNRHTRAQIAGECPRIRSVSERSAAARSRQDLRQPLFALPIGRLAFGERVTWREWAGAALTVAGIAVLSL